MKRSIILAALLALAGACPAHAAAAPAPAGPDKKQVAQQKAVDKVFDLSRLHVIDIVISDEGVRHLTDRSETRYHCTFTFDGLVLKDVGIRQAGGVFHAYQGVTGKPSLSIKFNEFVKGQDLHGLEKLVLKNQYQDQSLVNEHMTYEVFRRAGLPAAMTAYAVVTINGHLNGIYLMREPVNADFMVRNFGSGNETGNLYEFEFTNGDFVRSPNRVTLKDEVAEKRSRSDIIDLAAITQTVPDEFYVQAVAPVLDLDRALTYFAAEALTSHGDGFSYRNNNTYFYHLPSTGRLIIIPHGADAAFWATEFSMFRLANPYQTPPALLTRKILGVPALQAKYKAELVRISSAAVWDETALLERVAQVGRLLATAERTGQTASDIARFEANRATVEAFIRSHGTSQNGKAL